jgi:hypothetical protein
VLAVVALLMVTATELAAQTPTFNAVITTPTGTPCCLTANQAAVADFNGDGKVDVMVTDGGNGMRVLLGNNTGSFAAHTVSVPGGGPVPIRAADLNADGRMDVVFGNPQSNISPGVALNTGNNLSGVPQFSVTHYTALYNGTRSITVGDLNGDSKPDFVAGSSHGHMRVHLNNGNGTFAEQPLFFLSSTSEPSAGPGVIVDLNGDGKNEYVMASTQVGGTTIFAGNGDGTFGLRTLLPNNGSQIVSADVNGDAKIDLLVGNIGGGGTLNELMVYLNQGAGTFGSPAVYSAGGSPFQGNITMTTTDVNGDGKADATFGNSGSHTVTVLLNDGTGAFNAPVSFPTNNMPLHVTVGDFTGDGKLDIGTVSGTQRNYGVLTNTTPQVLETQTLTILGGVGSFGQIAANVEYFNPATQQWQSTYLVGGHPWGFVADTNSWINYKPSVGSDPGAGPTTNQTLWYLYRVRFTVPTDAIDPQMMFSLKADNFAQVAINGVTTGGSTQFINNTSMPNVIVGEANQVNSDGVFSQAIQPGENTITINMGDWGGLNGFNFRIDLKMKASAPIEIVPVDNDTTPPVITSPGDITAEATSSSGAAVTFAASATDDIDGAVTVTANPGSGSTFAIGVTTVNLSASDAAGNDATASFTVTVQDTIAPEVTAPGDIVAEATSANGADVVYPAATATDAVGVTSNTSNPPSGSTFPLGTTNVVVTAKDAAGNTGSDDFTVTVVDTTAPALNVPANRVLEATSASGAAATFAPSATDAVGVTSLTTTHASGSTFPIGTTSVGVSASDAAGNTTSGSFSITVQDTTAPSVGSVTPSTGSLWPPNHQMVNIGLTIGSNDIVGVVRYQVSVTSSEPDNGLGDGDTANDVQISGNGTMNPSVSLRSERSGGGSGRTYTISVVAIDAAGNASAARTATVVVPKSQGGKK